MVFSNIKLWPAAQIGSRPRCLEPGAWYKMLGVSPAIKANMLKTQWIGCVSTYSHLIQVLTCDSQLVSPETQQQEAAAYSYGGGQVFACGLTVIRRLSQGAQRWERVVPTESVAKQSAGHDLESPQTGRCVTGVLDHPQC